MDDNASQSNTCSQVTGLIMLLRPQRWVKNDFMPAPLMFTSAFVDSLCVYLALDVTNTFFFKYQPVLDIFSIALSFIMRVYAGTIALDMPVLGWIFVIILCLALYLAVVKRRQELSQSGTERLQVLEKYSKPLVDRNTEISAMCALVTLATAKVVSAP